MNDIDRLYFRMRGVKQKRLAELSGVSESTISRILAGKSDPRVSVLSKLHSTLDEMGVENAG